MAGDWIAMRLDLGEDPAVIAIANATGSDEFSVVGRLHKLWGWANQQLTDGSAPGVTPKWIDRYVLLDGFAAAMASAGWLVIRPDGVEFPKFLLWNTGTAKSRLLNARRVAKFKSQQREGNAGSVTSERPTEQNRTEQKKQEPTPGRVPPERRGKPAVYDPKSEALPFGGSAAFRSKWFSWCDYLEEKGWELARSTAEMQLSDLGKTTESAAIAMIENSIRHGWKGLFQPSGEKNGRPPPKPSSKDPPRNPAVERALSGEMAPPMDLPGFKPKT